jgi:hypothetical protein
MRSLIIVNQHFPIISFPETITRFRGIETYLCRMFSLFCLNSNNYYNEKLLRIFLIRWQIKFVNPLIASGANIYHLCEVGDENRTQQIIFFRRPNLSRSQTLSDKPNNNKL